jgi:hypothetical protein
MRLPAVALWVFLAIGTVAAANPLEVLQGTTPQQRADLQAQFMKQHLSLDSELLERVTTLNLATAKSVQPVTDGREGTFAKISALRSADEQKDAALKKLLPPEKYAPYESSKSDLKAYVEAGLAKAKSK